MAHAKYNSINRPARALPLYVPASNENFGRFFSLIASMQKMVSAVNIVIPKITTKLLKSQVKTFVLLIILLSGCNWTWHPDNRVRIKPQITIQQELSPERYKELQLYIMRNLYDQFMLQHLEVWLTARDGAKQ